MNMQMVICLVIFIISLIVYGINKLNMGVTAMLTMAALILTGCLDSKMALSKFADSNAIVLATMFIVAAGFSRTQLVNKLSSLIYKVGGGSFQKSLACFMLIVFIMMPFTGSPMFKFAIFYPVLSATCDRCGVSPSKAMFPLGLMCLLGGTGIPIGNAAVTYLKYNAYLETYGMESYTFHMMDPFISRAPIAIAILLYCIFLAPKMAPSTPPVPISGFEGKQRQQKPLAPFQEICGYSIFLLVSLGLIFADKLGIEQWLITLTGAVLMFATGVLTKKEVHDRLPLDIYLILVGALGLGAALVQTGAGDVIGNAIVNIIGDHTNGYFIGAVFFLIPFIMTQFMNNGATMNIVQPIVILACKALGCSPIGPVLLVQSACMSAFFTPMATSSIPMIMGAGGYDIKSLVKQGWLPGLICAVGSVFWTVTMFPIWG